MIALENVRAALALTDFDSVAAQRRMAPQPRTLQRSSALPGKPRQASVLVLLYPGVSGLALVLTQRTENERDVHSGQISLPGGSRENQETPLETALRETREEIGFDGEIEILGSLAKLYIPPSDFDVYPFVGAVPYLPVFQPDPREVHAILEFPLSWLLDDEHKVIEDWNYNGFQMRVPWYNVHDHRVWGATAIILSEFEQRLHTVLSL
ncbi:MAG TPA: CoA pyrophosphatase [Aggregatilineaceae bacterium]|nr:CoA pyrophosphatase [Aggregatilineaceae bacterium]